MVADRYPIPASPRAASSDRGLNSGRRLVGVWRVSMRMDTSAAVSVSTSRSRLEPWYPMVNTVADIAESVARRSAVGAGSR